MQKCADIVVNWMIRNHAIDETDRELYIYAVESFIILLLPLVYAGIIGYLVGNMGQGILVVLPFMLLRKYCGGYHAKSFIVCTILSSLLLLLCIVLAIRLNLNWQIILMTMIASVNLTIWSPIDSESRLLDQDEKYNYRKKAVCWLLIIWLVNIMLYILGQYSYVMAFCMGVLLTASLQLPCINKKMQK